MPYKYNLLSPFRWQILYFNIISARQHYLCSEPTWGITTIKKKQSGSSYKLGQGQRECLSAFGEITFCAKFVTKSYERYVRRVWCRPIMRKPSSCVSCAKPTDFGSSGSITSQIWVVTLRFVLLPSYALLLFIKKQ